MTRHRLVAEARELCALLMDLAWYGAVGTLVVGFLWLGLVMAFGLGAK